MALRSWRRNVLLCVVAGVPLVFLRNLNSSFQVPKLAWLFLGVGIAASILVVELAQGGTARVLRESWVPLAAVALPLVIAWTLSPYRGWAILGPYERLNGLVPYLAAIALAALIAEAFAGRPRPLMWALVAAGAIAGFFAVIQAIGLDPFDWSSDDIASTLGNSNFTGGFLGICCPIAIALIIVDESHRLPALLCGVLAVVGCAVSSSAGGWAAAAAGSLVTGGIVLAPRIRWSRLVGFCLAGLIALGVAGVVVAGLVGVRVPDTVDRRAQWWEAAIAMGGDHPIVGRGPAAFAIDHARYRTAKDAAEVSLNITDDPHSVPLAFLTSAGILGAAGLALAVAWVVRRVRAAGWEDLSRAGFVGALGAYGVQAFVSIDTVALRTAAWSCLGGLICTFFQDPDSDRKPSKKTSKKKVRSPARAESTPTKNLVIAAAVALSIFSLYWTGGFVRADYKFLEGARLFAEGEVMPAQEAYEEAIDFRNEIAYRRVLGRDMGTVAAAAGERGKPFIEDAREAFSYVDDIPHLNSIVDYARALKGWADVEPAAAEDALDLYVRAAGIDKYDAFLLEEASDHAIDLDRYEVVVDMLAPTAEEVDYVNVWANLAYAHANLGNTSAARAEAERALAVDPNQPVALNALEIVGD